MAVRPDKGAVNWVSKGSRVIPTKLRIPGSIARNRNALPLTSRGQTSTHRQRDNQRRSIAGVGNVLLGDDAIGLYVVRALEALYQFPAQVRLEDFGTPGLDLVAHVSGTEALILIDAANSEEPPGLSLLSGGRSYSLGCGNSS